MYLLLAWWYDNCRSCIRHQMWWSDI